MRTLNQIIAQITDIGEAHQQLDSVGVGTTAELQALERAYPLLWIDYQSTDTDTAYLTNSIRLIVADRVITGEEGDDNAGMEQEVLSDSLSILVDIISYFVQQHNEEYVVERVNNLIPFTEDWNDRVAGHSVILQIRQFQDWNKCQIPETGAAIPPSVDGLTLYDFCDQSVLDRLTAAQNACLTTAFGNCDPATLTVNGASFTTVDSGDSLDIAVHDTADANVGTVVSVSEIEIADNTINFNGSNVDTVKAEETYTFTVELDSVQSGTYDAGTNKVSVTSTPTVCPSLTIGVYSDAGLTTPITEATFGDTIYINLDVTGITTPTEYRFFVCDSGMVFNFTSQGTATLSWLIAGLDDLVIYGEAVDATDAACALLQKDITLVMDADAKAFIVAHNAASGAEMEYLQMITVVNTYLMLKGADTTNNSDLWTILDGSNSEIYPFVPVSDTLANASAYALDMVDPSIAATWVNFTTGDFSVNGVTGGSTKYLAMKRAPSDFGQNDAGADAYSRSSLAGTSNVVVGATAVAIGSSSSTLLNISSNLTYSIVNTNTSGGTVTSSGLGLFSVNRNNSANVQTYDSGVQINSVTLTSVAPTTNKFYGVANNTNGTAERNFTGQLAMVCARSGFTAAEITDWNEVWEYFQTNIITGGRNA